MPGREQLHRLRVEYCKDGRLAYLGHLEVINTMGRCIRRSGLPFSVGNGFARRIRLQFSQALPVGASSRCEYYDLLLTERVGEKDALCRLGDATPGGLAPLRCGYVPRELPALEAWLTRSAWEVSFSQGIDRAALDDALRQLLNRGSLEYKGREEKGRGPDPDPRRVGLGRAGGAHASDAGHEPGVAQAGSSPLGGSGGPWARGAVLLRVPCRPVARGG
jgi:radical SAM-linked protein